MKFMQADKRVKKAFWLRGPLLLATVPVTLFVLGLIALALNERQAADRVEAEVSRIRAAGHPLDNGSLRQWYLENTSREGTKDWNDILRLANAGTGSFGNSHRLPYVGTGATRREIAPGVAWPDEPEVAEYLRWMRPVIERIHDASELPAPVWQPIEFHGFSTLLSELQNSRGVVRLLQLETEHAIYHRDTQRALRNLESMQAAAAAFDWPFCMHSDLLQIALRRTHQSMVRRSLATAIWNDAELLRLSIQLGPPREVSQRWQDVIAGERAMMMASVKFRDIRQPNNSAPLWIFALPSAREQLLQAYREVDSVGAAGIGELRQRAERLTRKWQAESEKARSFVLFPSQVIHALLPAIEHYSDAIERDETSRRFALTALAIKRFQLSEGHWPENLSQLEQVGLNANQWQTVSGGPFGYELEGDKAILWSYDSQKASRVSSTRPEIKASRVSSTRPEIDVEEGGNEWLVTTIR